MQNRAKVHNEIHQAANVFIYELSAKPSTEFTLSAPTLIMESSSMIIQSRVKLIKSASL
jgi:hypothetical protein